tara:strand:- start:252 stop:671 length:420 start_codon:yes stop_codon:yes gene_type:complete
MSSIPVASPVYGTRKGMLVKLTSQGYLYESGKNLGGKSRNKSYYDNLVGVVYWKNNSKIAVWWSVFYPYFNSYTSGCKGETVILSYPIEMEKEIMYGIETRKQGNQLFSSSPLFPDHPNKGVVVDVDGRMMWQDYYGPR